MTLSWLLASYLLPAASGTAAAPADTAKTSRHGFTASLSYGSNSAYFGRTQATAFPYAATNLAYSATSGLFASVEFYNLLNTAPLLDETDVSGGWTGNFSKTVDASASYSRFVFATGSELVKSSVNNSVDAYVGKDWGPFYSRLNGSYLFGKSLSGDGFLTVESSRYVEYSSLFTAKDYISVEPQVSVAAGTQSFAEAGLTKRHGTRARSSSSFGIVDYELSVPLTYTLGKVALDAGWRYVVPVNLPPDDVDSLALSIWSAGLTLTL